jgi:hypothetical protein
LRLDSKAIFNPSLKDPQTIVIEDDGSHEFSIMEEIVVHTLKNMTRDKGKLEFYKRDAS